MSRYRRSHGERRRRPRIPRLLVLFVLAALLFFFAPQLLLRTSLRESVLQRSTQGLGVDVSVGDISASWFTPLTARGGQRRRLVG